MNPAGAAWYLRRLRRMTPQEVAWRTVDVARRRALAPEQAVPGATVGVPPGTLARPAFPRVLPPGTAAAVPDDVAKAVVVTADGLLEGDWEVLGHRRPDIAAPHWFLDVVTGIEAPSRSLAFSVNHRDEGAVGNIKSLWEVSRHHHLTLLASAWWLTGDDRYAEVVAEQLNDWWAENPFLSGIHWTSGIELGIRLISWTWIRRLLEGWSGAPALFEENDAAKWQLWWHQRYLAQFPSRGTSSNNHVIAEAAGLLVAASAFPWFRESARWAERSKGLLEHEMQHNTFESGLNRELATDYHAFVTELALVAAVESSAAGIPLAGSTWSLLGRSLDTAAAILDCSGRPPRQGDGDDGLVLLLDGPTGNPWPRLLGIGRALVGDAAWWPRASGTVASVALRAMAGEQRPLPHLESRPDEFPDAGLTILRSSGDGLPELWCRCDAGPHGFLAIAAHAHADALSIEFRHDGIDVLADPGTYCYHGETAWREYFRSTLGHNTLELDGEDQSESGGPFLWTRHADTRVTSPGGAPDGSVVWSAAHNGYARRGRGVVHHRRVTLTTEPPEGRTLLVEDRLSAAAAKPARMAWHLGPGVDVALVGARATLQWDGRGARWTATMDLPEQLRWTSHRGETDPVLGWYSPSFGVRVPSTTLIGSGRLEPQRVHRTRLRLHGDAVRASSDRLTSTAPSAEPDGSFD